MNNNNFFFFLNLKNVNFLLGESLLVLTESEEAGMAKQLAAQKIPIAKIEVIIFIIFCGAVLRIFDWAFFV